MSVAPVIYPVQENINNTPQLNIPNNTQVTQQNYQTNTYNNTQPMPLAPMTYGVPQMFNNTQQLAFPNNNQQMSLTPMTYPAPHMVNNTPQMVNNTPQMFNNTPQLNMPNNNQQNNEINMSLSPQVYNNTNNIELVVNKSPNNNELKLGNYINTNSSTVGTITRRTTKIDLNDWLVNENTKSTRVACFSPICCCKNCCLITFCCVGMKKMIIDNNGTELKKGEWTRVGNKTIYFHNNNGLRFFVCGIVTMLLCILLPLAALIIIDYLIYLSVAIVFICGCSIGLTYYMFNHKTFTVFMVITEWNIVEFSGKGGNKLSELDKRTLTWNDSQLYLRKYFEHWSTRTKNHGTRHYYAYGMRVMFEGLTFRRTLFEKREIVRDFNAGIPISIHNLFNSYKNGGLRQILGFPVVVFPNTHVHQNTYAFQANYKVLEDYKILPLDYAKQQKMI